MSDLWAETYSYAVAVTKSDSVDDPAGPFAGLYVGGTGALKMTMALTGATLTVDAIAGTYIRWPVKRVWSGGTAATVFGLVGSIVKQGP